MKEFVNSQCLQCTAAVARYTETSHLCTASCGRSAQYVCTKLIGCWVTVWHHSTAMIVTGFLVLMWCSFLVWTVLVFTWDTSFTKCTLLLPSPYWNIQLSNWCSVDPWIVWELLGIVIWLFQDVCPYGRSCSVWALPPTYECMYAACTSLSNLLLISNLWKWVLYASC